MSTISVDNITDKSAAETVDATYVVHGTAKAWWSLNGTGTIAARDSLNVSSFDDDGTGHYGANFTNAFGAADYGATHWSDNVIGSNTAYVQDNLHSYSTGEMSWQTTNSVPTAFDSPFTSHTLLGDLA